MKTEDILHVLEDMAPLSLQEDYDNSGLIVGSAKAEVNAALVSLDCTEAVLDEAIDMECNLIISHHPFLFSGIKKITGKTYQERILIKAIQNDINIYALHTNFDNIPEGVNATICKRIGLQRCVVLSPSVHSLKKLYTFCPESHAEKLREGLFSAGCGVIGAYSKCSFNTEGYGTFFPSVQANPYTGNKNELNKEREIRIETVFPAYAQEQIVEALIRHHPYDEVAYDIVSLDIPHAETGAGMIGYLDEPLDAISFLKMLKKRFNAAVVRHTKPLNKNVRKIAVCGGAGSYLLPEAKAQKADAFVTSDIKYHQFFDTGNQMLIADIGHYESEQFACHAISDTLKEKFPTFAVHLSKVNTNPVNYL